MLTVQISFSIEIAFTGRWIHTLKEKRFRPPHTDRYRLEDLMLNMFQLFLDLILLTGDKIHTLKEKETDHHILTGIAWWLSAQQFHLFLDLILFTRNVSTHWSSKNETTTYWQTIDWRIWCSTVPIVSWLNSVHRETCPHTKIERIKPTHTDCYRLMN